MSAIQSSMAEKNAKKHATLTRKFQLISCPTTHSYFLQKTFTILWLFANLFPPKGSLVNAQQKKKMGKEKQKKQGGEKAKSKSQGGRKTFSKKSCEKNLFSVHARTSKAVIWHQVQKLV